MKRELILTLTTDGEHVTGLAVRLPRFEATTLLAQRQAAVAATLLPSVFSICAQAQGAAAAAALSAAGGQPLSPALIAGHTLAVQLESVQESLRSLCFGLPEAAQLRQAAQGAALIVDFSRVWRDSTALLARLQKVLRSEVDGTATELTALKQEARAMAQDWDVFCARHIYGMSVLRWQGEETDNTRESTLPVMHWFQQMAEEVPALGRMALSPLPLAMFRSGKLSWRALLEMPYDASAWWRVQQDARMALVEKRLGNSVAARLWARLVDVARTLAELLAVGQANKTAAAEGGKPWIRIYPLGDGEGMAEVECARGVLVHRVQLAQQKLAQQNVVTYDVCAPTDWNLHRGGALATLLGWPAADLAQLRRQATWLVQVLDPCVVFDIEVIHA